MVIDKKLYEKDVLILPSGKILQRPMPKGTHVICFSEFSEILKEKPRVIIIGTGEVGCAELETGAMNKIKEQGVRIIVQPTGEAIKSYNKCKEEKAGLFHLTC